MREGVVITQRIRGELTGKVPPKAHLVRFVPSISDADGDFKWHPKIGSGIHKLYNLTLNNRGTVTMNFQH
jgi:hypothetical protein